MGKPGKDGHGKAVLPLCLLPAGRNCLVVGGGQIAGRKAAALLEAEALVTVIAPSVSPQIRELAIEGSVVVHERAFESSDVKDAFLVFAATDDPAVNNAVVTTCREDGVLAGVVDHGWENGDFISPAAFTTDGLTVAVSTGGRSCRRSRMVKTNIARHIEMIEHADLLVVGTDHNHLPLGPREELLKSDASEEEIAKRIAIIWGIHEFILLRTCNRIEIIAVAANRPVIESMLNMMIGLESVAPDQRYAIWGRDAFAHTALLTSGLLSQVPGENHITAQLKTALGRSEEQGWSGPVMHDWIGTALHVSKDIRSATGAILKECEIEDVAMTRLDTVTGNNALVVGSGTVAVPIAERLAASGRRVTMCCRTAPANAPAGVNIAGMDRLSDELKQADIAVCATSSQECIIDSEQADVLSDGRVRVILDIALPRNVESGLAKTIPNLTVIDLDDLKHWYRREMADMDEVRRLASDVIEDNIQHYDRIIDSLQGGNQGQ